MTHPDANALRDRFEALAAELDYYASKTTGGTWAEGAQHAASQIRKVLKAES